MKETRYYKGQDVRAVESPYEAAFNLANMILVSIRRSRLILIGLLIVLVYYLATIVGAIVFNIVYGWNRLLNAVGVVVSLIMLSIAIIAIWRIFQSNAFMKELGSHQELMLKIGSIDTSSRAEPEGGSGGRMTGRPEAGLMSLVQSASSHSRTLAVTFRYVVGFIATWWIAGASFLAIQAYRFGTSLQDWQLDWLLPGGIDFMILVAATGLILLVLSRYEFFRRRYEAIDYALNVQPAAIPEGRDAIERFRKFAASQTADGRMTDDAAWKKGEYFDALAETGHGMLLVKYAKGVPSADDVRTLRKKAAEQCGPKPLDRVVLLFKEVATEPVSDEAYDLANEALVRGRDVGSVQLVAEGADGNYDFMPTVSF